MAQKPQNHPYFEQAEKRDILDIMDSYKYMNSPLLGELFAEGLWDHGSGWVQLNIPHWEWRVRFNQELPSPFPIAAEY